MKKIDKNKKLRGFKFKPRIGQYYCQVCNLGGTDLFVRQIVLNPSFFFSTDNFKWHIGMLEKFQEKEKVLDGLTSYGKIILNTFFS